MKINFRKKPASSLALLPLLMAFFIFNSLQAWSQCNYCNDQGKYGIIQVDSKEDMSCVEKAYKAYCPNVKYLLVTNETGRVMDVKAMPTGGAASRTASINDLKSLTEKELMNTPELSRIKAFPGSGGCTLYSGDNALALRPELAQRSAARTAAAPDPLTLCRKDCDKSIKWAFTPVSAEKNAGFYIQPTDKSNQALCWNAEEGLSLRTPSINELDDCMVWHVAIGQIEKGEISGYRIVSKAAPNYGLAVEKTSGAVTVKPYLEEAVAAKASMKNYQVTKDYESIWTMTDCSKPLPPKHQPKEKKAQD